MPERHFSDIQNQGNLYKNLNSSVWRSKSNLRGAAEREKEADLDDGPDALVVEVAVGPDEALGGFVALPLGLRDVDGHRGRLKAQLEHSAVIFAWV